MTATLADWISFGVAFGLVAPWLLAGACLLMEWTCEALIHHRRMRTDPMYREVEIQFAADLIAAGLGGRTIRIRSILWWVSIVASACLLLSDLGWLLSMRWLWLMATPLIALEFAFILVAAISLNLVAVSFASRLRSRRNPPHRSETDDSDDWDDFLRAVEALSAQYDAIADGDHRRTAALAHRLHTGFRDERPRETETVRLVKRDHGEP